MDTIIVSKEVKAAIEALSKFGDTHDSILKRLLNMKNESWGHENKETWPNLPNPYVPKNSNPPENIWPLLNSPYAPRGLPGIVEQKGPYIPRRLPDAN